MLMRKPIERMEHLSGMELEAVIQEMVKNYQQYNLHEFILPFGKKNCWTACAKFIVSLPDEAIIPILPDVMSWLQDPTWPGSREIIDRILQMPDCCIKEACRIAYQRALEDSDEEWIYSLKSIFGKHIY